MERGAHPETDWRDAAAYAPLFAADRAILAWEWIRRVPGFRHDALATMRGSGTPAAGAESWGLHRYEDCSAAAPLARPLWTAAAFDAVLAVEGPLAPLIGLLAAIAPGAELTVAELAGGYRVLVGNGWRAVRLDVEARSVAAGSNAMRFRLDGPPRLAAQLMTLRRFEALVRTGRFVAALHPPEPRAAREVLLLRTADALAAGATQRTIAAALLDPAASEPAWRAELGHVRLRAQRLVRDARARLAGGYRCLLRP